MGVGLFSQVTNDRMRENGVAPEEVQVQYQEEFCSGEDGQVSEWSAQGSGGVPTLGGQEMCEHDTKGHMMQLNLIVELDDPGMRFSAQMIQ